MKNFGIILGLITIGLIKNNEAKLRKLILTDYDKGHVQWYSL